MIKLATLLKTIALWLPLGLTGLLWFYLLIVHPLACLIEGTDTVFNSSCIDGDWKMAGVFPLVTVVPCGLLLWLLFHVLEGTLQKIAERKKQHHGG